MVKGGVLAGGTDDGGVLVFGTLGAMHSDGEGGLKVWQLVDGVWFQLSLSVAEPCLPSPIGDANVAIQKTQTGCIGGENDGVVEMVALCFECSQAGLVVRTRILPMGGDDGVFPQQ